MHHDGLKKNGGSAPFKAAVPGVTFHKQGNRRKSFGEILVTSDGRLWPKTTFKDTRVGTCRCCVWHLLSLSFSPQDMVIKYYTSPCWFVVVAKTHWLRSRERGRGTRDKEVLWSVQIFIFNLAAVSTKFGRNCTVTDDKLIWVWVWRLHIIIKSCTLNYTVLASYLFSLPK